MPQAHSLRDPAGQLIKHGDEIFRAIRSEYAGEVEDFLQSEQCKRLIKQGTLIRTEIADRQSKGLEESPWSGNSLLLKHERILFPSYPYEWPAEMLHAAAELTIDLADELLREGRGIKDATPNNVLFRGPEPIFTDFLSIQTRNPLDPTWLAYAQFVRTFLLPLMVYQKAGLAPGQIFLDHRDGLEPREAGRLLSVWQKLSPLALSLIVIPCWLENKGGDSIYRRKTAASGEHAQFILRRLFGNLKHQLSRLSSSAQSSKWASYAEQGSVYSSDELATKMQFVKTALKEASGSRLLDVGCNTGIYSLAGAQMGYRVVAVDADPVVTGKVWQSAKRNRLDVLPLCVDMARPTPGTGWLNQECASFLDRARGQFDVVMLLALIHHLTITERIPMAEVASLCASLTTKEVIVEYVPFKDPMFQRLLRGRAHLHADYNQESFEAAWQKEFHLKSQRRLSPSGRILYCFRKKNS